VSEDVLIDLGRRAMLVTLLVSAPMLVSGLVIGLIISIFQSVTQIQEITLTFVPKIVIVMLAFILFLPWMLALLLGFVQPLLGDFASLTG
jgi:flagellar biosynthesis protein FliQ